jgi:hypothetical protein
MVSCRASPQGLDLPAGEGAGAVGVLSSSVQVGGGVSAQPASLGPPRHRRTQRGELAVPSRRGGVAVAAGEPDRKRHWLPGTNAQRETGKGGAVDPAGGGGGATCARPTSAWSGDVVTRLRFAAQLATVRAIGTFLADPSAVPAPISPLWRVSSTSPSTPPQAYPGELLLTTS